MQREWEHGSPPDNFRLMANSCVLAGVRSRRDVSLLSAGRQRCLVQSLRAAEKLVHRTGHENDVSAPRGRLNLLRVDKPQENLTAGALLGLHFH
jgi:hypothetical protein